MNTTSFPIYFSYPYAKIPEDQQQGRWAPSLGGSSLCHQDGHPELSPLGYQTMYTFTPACSCQHCRAYTFRPGDQHFCPGWVNQVDEGACNRSKWHIANQDYLLKRHLWFSDTPEDGKRWISQSRDLRWLPRGSIST